MCGRRFAPDRLGRHQLACVKSASAKKRKAYPSAAEDRLEGTEFAKYAVAAHTAGGGGGAMTGSGGAAIVGSGGSGAGGGKRAVSSSAGKTRGSPVPPSLPPPQRGGSGGKQQSAQRVSWRQQHEEFQAIARANKGPGVVARGPPANSTAPSVIPSLGGGGSGGRSGAEGVDGAEPAGGGGATNASTASGNDGAGPHSASVATQLLAGEPSSKPAGRPSGVLRNGDDVTIPDRNGAAG